MMARARVFIGGIDMGEVDVSYGASPEPNAPDPTRWTESFNITRRAWCRWLKPYLGGSRDVHRRARIRRTRLLGAHNRWTYESKYGAVALPRVPPFYQRRTGV